MIFIQELSISYDTFSINSFREVCTMMAEQIYTSRGRRFILVLALFCILSLGLLPGLGFRAFAVDEADTPQTEAVSAILFDARRGQVILSKASDEISHSPLANRIMTILIAFEKADTEGMVTISKDVVNTEGATLNLSVGEKYALKNLLSALSLIGSVDACKAVAEYVGGSESGFVTIMNEYAQKLGMTDTHFTNSTGVYDEDQYTTNKDILILMKYALSNSNFNRLFSTQAKTWYSDTKTILLTNTNNMFWSYPDTDGGMAASFDKDIQSIVTTVTRNNMRLVCILLDVPTKKMYEDSSAFLNYGFDNYLYGTLVPAGSSQRVITIDQQTLNLVPKSDVYYVHPKGETYIKDININVDDTKLKPPVTKNTVMGMLTYTLEDGTVINVELYPDREILPQKTKAQIMKDRLIESRELIYVILGLIVIELIMGLSKIYSYLRKQVIKSRARKRRRR